MGSLETEGDADGLSAGITVRAQKFSKSARAKIEAAGGTAIELDTRGREASAES